MRSNLFSVSLGKLCLPDLDQHFAQLPDANRLVLMLVLLVADVIVVDAQEAYAQVTQLVAQSLQRFVRRLAGRWRRSREEADYRDDRSEITAPGMCRNDGERFPQRRTRSMPMQWQRLQLAVERCGNTLGVLNPGSSCPE